MPQEYKNFMWEIDFRGRKLPPFFLRQGAKKMLPQVPFAAQRELYFAFSRTIACVGTRALHVSSVQSVDGRRVLGRHLCRLITKIASSRNDPIKLLRSSTHHREEFKCPPWSDYLICTRVADHPFFGCRKIANKYGHWCSTGSKLAFVHPRPQEIENLLFCPFGECFFGLFFVSYTKSLLFFFCFFPNTPFFCPNKSHCMIFCGFP